MVLEQKLDKFIETTNENLTKIQINQARLEGKTETLEVKLEEKTKALQSGQDAIDSKINVQNTWLLSLITGLVIVGLVGLVGTIGKIVFFPTPNL